VAAAALALLVEMHPTPIKAVLVEQALFGLLTAYNMLEAAGVVSIPERVERLERVVELPEQPLVVDLRLRLKTLAVVVAAVTTVGLVLADRAWYFSMYQPQAIPGW
jgi:hypothetical protein